MRSQDPLQFDLYPVKHKRFLLEENFATFPLRDILEKRIPPNSLRDRLVLIGTTSESIKDVFYTRYNSGLFTFSQPMTGVSIHANIISQIISAAVDGRPLLRVWQEPIEWLWILVWAGLAALVSRQLRSSMAIAASIIFASAGLLGIGFLALGGLRQEKGFWILNLLI